jgi:hypothetical protein
MIRACFLSRGVHCWPWRRLSVATVLFLVVPAHGAEPLDMVFQVYRTNAREVNSNLTALNLPHPLMRDIIFKKCPRNGSAAALAA